MSEIDERDTHDGWSDTEDKDVEFVEQVDGDGLPDEVDVDTDFANTDDDDEVEETPAGTDANKPAKTAKEPKAPAAPKRGDLPEGYCTPVGLAKIITERGLYTTRDGEKAELKPQMVYSYAKNAPKDNPFPAQEIEDSNGNKRNVVEIEAGVTWWVNKNARAQERRDNAAAKLAEAAKKAVAKASATEAEDDEGDGAEATEAE
jgi:hypothetical protein